MRLEEVEGRHRKLFSLPPLSPPGVEARPFIPTQASCQKTMPTLSVLPVNQGLKAISVETAFFGKGGLAYPNRPQGQQKCPQMDCLRLGKERDTVLAKLIADTSRDSSRPHSVSPHSLSINILLSPNQLERKKWGWYTIGSPVDAGPRLQGVAACSVSNTGLWVEQ
ncbi:hypothetical protein Q8A73_010578 [Channa argus]|nr:hypothetical protein Q8A73_010578 [Channa argus]